MTPPRSCDAIAPSDLRDWSSAPQVELIQHIVLVHHPRTRLLLEHVGGIINQLNVFPASDDHQRFVSCFLRLSHDIIEHLEQEEHTLFPACAAWADPDRLAESGTLPTRELAMHALATGHALARQEIAHLKALAASLPIGNKPHTSAIVFRLLSELDTDLNEHGRLEEILLMPMVLAPHSDATALRLHAHTPVSPADGAHAWPQDDPTLVRVPEHQTTVESSATLMRPYPSEYIIPAELKDGTWVTIRPVKTSDRERMAAFLGHVLNHPDGYSYYGGVASTPGGSIERFIHVCFADYSRELVVLAERVGDGSCAILGMGRLSRDLTANQADVTIVVMEQESHHWLGTQLVCALIDIGRRERFERLITHLTPENDGVQHLYAMHGFHFRPGATAGQLIGELDYLHL